MASGLSTRMELLGPQLQLESQCETVLRSLPLLKR
jgi:hypothetical protein